MIDKINKWFDTRLLILEGVFLFSYISETIELIAFRNDPVVVEALRHIPNKSIFAFLDSLIEWNIAYFDIAFQNNMAEKVWGIFIVGLIVFAFGVSVSFYARYVWKNVDNRKMQIEERETTAKITIIVNICLLLLFLHLFISPIVLLILASLLLGANRGIEKITS